MPINTVIKNIKENISKSMIDNEAITILRHMICLGVGDYSISTTLQSMNSKDSQLASFVAKYTNNIYGSLIVIKNMSMLNEEQQAYIKKIAEIWKLTNTLIFFE